MEEFWAQRWKALTYVFFMGFILAVNYTNHGPLVPTLVKSLNITYAMAGLFTTAIFLAHGALQIPGGALSDKFGAKNICSIGMLIIAVGNIFIGFSNSYYQILVWKFIVGIGTGSAIVGGLRYVPTFFAGKEIQRAQGLYGGSILLGAGFVIYGIPQLLKAVGWHGVFFITGGLAAIFFVLWVLFAPKTPITGTVAKIDWGKIIGSRNIWILSLAQLASFGTIISAGVWVNTLLIKSLHLVPITAGMIGSIVLLLGILSRPLGGYILDHGFLTSKKLLIYSCIGLGLGYILIGLSSWVPMAIFSITFTGIMAGLPFAGIFNGAKDSCPANPGLAMGFVNTWGSFGVMALPPIIGRLVDLSGTFMAGFFVMGVIAVLAGICTKGLALATDEVCVTVETETTS